MEYAGISKRKRLLPSNAIGKCLRGKGDGLNVRPGLIPFTAIGCRAQYSSGRRWTTSKYQHSDQCVPVSPDRRAVGADSCGRWGPRVLYGVEFGICLVEIEQASKSALAGRRYSAGASLCCISKRLPSSICLSMPLLRQDRGSGYSSSA